MRYLTTFIANTKQSPQDHNLNFGETPPAQWEIGRYTRYISQTIGCVGKERSLVGNGDRAHCVQVALFKRTPIIGPKKGFIHYPQSDKSPGRIRGLALGFRSLLRTGSDNDLITLPGAVVFFLSFFQLSPVSATLFCDFQASFRLNLFEFVG